MPYKKRNPRAFALSLVLFFSLITAMYVSAAVSLAPSSLARTSTDYAQLAADQAAGSGIDWARGRLSQDPNWCAVADQTFTGTDLFVREKEGQVTGWIRQNQSWSRFRLRFNYQDGPQVAVAGSDNMDDPAAPWSDMPYVSSNNLTGGSARTAPVARGSSGQSQSSSPWPVKQLDVPPYSLLLSVEGSSGSGVVESGGNPTNFSGAFHRRTVQTMMKFGNNQPISEAAIMSAGDLDVQLFGAAKLMLSAASSASVARLRSKDRLTFNTGVQSNNGDLRYGVTPTPAIVTAGTVSTGSDGATDGFFRIPANKVRTPSGGISLDAGVYVVTSGGQVLHYPMDYAAYATATPAPTGTPVALPSGMALIGPNASPTPKYQVRVTSDITINPAGGAKDFALLPDGGADQSAPYAGAPSSSPSPTATPVTESQLASYLFSGVGSAPTLNAAGFAAWQTWASGQGSAQSPGVWGAGWTDYTISSSPTVVVRLPDSYPNALPNGQYPWISGPPGQQVAQMANTLASDPAAFAALAAAFPVPGPGGSPSPSPSPSASATPPLKPKDLELQLQGGSRGLTMSATGSIVLGSQIDGNGAALVSKEDIALIGTSTELSSRPGTQLGLNLYAQKTITIDTFKLDSAGSSEFRGISLAGIVYAWQGVNIYAGNSTASGPFTLKGSIVSYGGDPASAPLAGSAKTNIRASSADIQYDPALATNLLQSGPFLLQTVSWHQF